MIARVACLFCVFGMIASGPGGFGHPRTDQQSIAARSSSVVTAHAVVSLEPVPAGREFEIAVVTRIAQGYHMNSNKPSDEYLIPTTVTVQTPEGFRLLSTNYPPGRDAKFAFSPGKPLNVYTGQVAILLRLAAQSGARPGRVNVPLTLRYQACNDTTCLPPVKLPLSAEFELAVAGAKARAVHPELFSSKSTAHD